MFICSLVPRLSPSTLFYTRDYFYIILRNVRLNVGRGESLGARLVYVCAYTYVFEMMKVLHLTTLDSVNIEISQLLLLT